MNKEIMRAIGFGPEVNLIDAGRCPLCTHPVDPSSFSDALSRREWEISGLCQSCQIETFGTNTERD